MDMLDITKALLSDFAREEEGSQVVEYALVIALVSIVLAIALAKVAGDTPFSALATRISNCFATNATSC